MPICAHVYKRPSLSFSCLSVRMSTKDLPYLSRAYLCACLQKIYLIFLVPICAHVYKRPSLSFSCLSVRMSTKDLPYLSHAYLCACLQRLSLSSACILITLSFYKMYSIHRTFVKVELEQWHLENGMLKVSCCEILQNETCR